MKVILNVIAIVVSCGAAFFSFTQSQKFQALEKERQAAIADTTKVSAEASTAEGELAKENEAFAKIKESRTLLEQSVSQAKSEGASLSSELAKLDSELKSQDGDFAQLNKVLQDVNAALENLEGGVTLETLPAKIEETEKAKADKQKKLEDLNGLIASAEKNVTTSHADLDRLAKKVIERNARISRNSLEAVVTAVNPGWGFVVIGAGSNSGFTPQTALLVQRDGRKIARLTPSSVEATQTIAEIDADSVAPGVRIQPGDRVILETPASN